MDAVTAVLQARRRQPEGLRRMVSISFAAHLVALTAIALIPAVWFSHGPQTPDVVMNISLGGNAPGPYTGGMTTLGGRPIQEIATLPKPPRPAAIRPPAEKTPAMVLPERKTRVRRKPRPEVKEAVAPSWNRKPITGPKVQAGSSVAQTGATGMGFGLSTGGGGTGGYLDVKNFCCPGYVATMTELIRRLWDGRQEVPGETMIRFTIQRNGLLTNVEIERSSGYAALDLAAERAVIMTRQLPPLPADFTNPTLTVHLNFQYTRQ